MTPYELSLTIECYTESKEAELQESLTLVWLGEYYHRTKRLPSLKSELQKLTPQTKKEMSDSEMLEVVKMLNTQFGGTFKNGGE